MRLVIQRVQRACAHLPSQEKREISRGLLLLLGIAPSDTEEVCQKMAEKAARLRLFPDAEGKFDLSLLDVSGQALVVSQFTLYGNCQKGRRPDFTQAAPPEKAKPLYESFVRNLKKLGLAVQTGEFGAAMEVELTNDGPVTMILDS